MNRLKTELLIAIALLMIAGQASATGTVNIGNYVRGSSPVVGGFISPPTENVDIPYRSYYVKISGTNYRPWYNTTCSSIPNVNWVFNQDTLECEYQGDYLSVDYALEVPAGHLPRHFGIISYDNTWVWGSYRHYLNPHCPANTATIKASGYKTNDGKDYGFVGAKFAAMTNENTFTDAFGRYSSPTSCPKFSSWTATSTCTIESPIEVTLCVATDTEEE